MTANYAIHPMSIDDFDEVVSLWEETEGVGLSESDSRSCIDNYLKRNPGLSFVARNANQEVIGAVLCGHDGLRGYLRHLAVSKEYRGQGIGKTLIERCLSRLQSTGLHRCTIFILRDNKEGQRFWSRCGWKSRSDLHVMQRALNP